MTNIKYLDFIIKIEKGIYINPEKIKTIKEWKAPITVKNIKNFFNFVNFYQ